MAEGEYYTYMLDQLVIELNLYRSFVMTHTTSPAGFETLDMPALVRIHNTYAPEDLQVEAWLGSRKDLILDIMKVLPSPEAEPKAITSVPNGLLALVTAAMSCDTEPKPAKKVPGPAQGIGTKIKAMILEGLDNKTILAKILADHPSAKTTMKCVYWYRNDLKKVA